jgi:transposase
MNQFVGLDVSVRETSICVVNFAGRIHCEMKVASDGSAIVSALLGLGISYERIGLEASNV